MYRRALILAALVHLALSGCAIGPEHRVLRGAGVPVELVDVPFFPQAKYQCGPAALATVLVHSGVDVTPDQMVSRVYLPDREGSLQAELLAATRGEGRVPYLLPATLAPILEELRAGQPVLLLQNLGFDRWPIWHYAVLIGFDPARDEFLLRSGTTRRERRAAAPFLASWDRGGRWSLVAVTASNPPGSADALGWLRAIAPFESLGDFEMAVEGYEAAAVRWPKEPLVWAALGNVRYLQQELTAAETAYRRALELSPELWTARNNLVQTIIAGGCAERAQSWIREGESPPPDFAPVWNRTLEQLAVASTEHCYGGNPCFPGCISK